MSYEYMTGFGAVQQQNVGIRPAQVRPGVGVRGGSRTGGQMTTGRRTQQAGRIQRRGGQQAARPLTDEMKARIRQAACGGQPCSDEMPQRHFFTAMYKQNNPDVTQRLEGKGCTQQCIQNGITFYCCPPQPKASNGNGVPSEEEMLFEETMLDDSGMDYGMDPGMIPDMAPPEMMNQIVVANGEEEKKPPWLLIGGGVLAVGIIGYLLATRK